MISVTGQTMVMSSSSKFAGRVGMLDILNGLGLRLLALGFNTPFLVIVISSHSYFWHTSNVHCHFKIVLIPFMVAQLSMLMHMVFGTNCTFIYKVPKEYVKTVIQQYYHVGGICTVFYD